MPSCTIASIRAWPNAPRDCLLASTSRSVVTCDVRSVRFLCALSMMPSRSCSTRKLIHGVARGRFHRLADAVRHRIQPLVDRARHLGLAAHQRLRHGVDPSGGLALRPQHFAQALFQFVGADRLRHRQFRAPAARAGDDDGDHQQQHQSERAEPGQRLANVNRQVADDEKNFVHAAM